MTIVEAEIAEEARLGLNLAIAREDMCCTILNGADVSLRTQALDGFVAALDDYTFGDTAPAPINDEAKAAQIIHIQLGCLAAMTEVGTDTISEKLAEHTRTQELRDAVASTIRTFVSPLLEEIRPK